MRVVRLRSVAVAVVIALVGSLLWVVPVGAASVGVPPVSASAGNRDTDSATTNAAGSDTDSATTNSGGGLDVRIVSPVSGSVTSGGSVVIEGVASVGGGVTNVDTVVVVGMDVSGSALWASGGSCGDSNGDGKVDTVLDCEINAVSALERSAVANGRVGEFGVSVFGWGGWALDMQPGAGGLQRLTRPGTDSDGDGVTDVVDAVIAAGVTGGTNFSAGLRAACESFTAASLPNQVLVFISDGQGGQVSAADCVVKPRVYAIAVGANSSCEGGLNSVVEVGSSGECFEVTNAADLPDFLGGVLEPEITGLSVSVNGGAEKDISSALGVSLPARGPVSLDWSATVEGLVGPEDEVCVNLSGRLGSEVMGSSSCVKVVDNSAPVANAGVDQSVDEGELVILDGSGSVDADGDPLTYSWVLSSSSGQRPVVSAGSEPVFSFLALDDGVYEFTLTVSDGRSTSSDSVSVTVGNVAPVLSTVSEPGARFGVTILTASFSDAGLLDTHSATIDWGDGTVDTRAVSGQGSGWGTVFGSHIYSSPGVYSATVTVTDDDGGTVSSEPVSVKVDFALALWAASDDGIDWSGGGSVSGLTHSEGSITTVGEAKSFDGPVEYVTYWDAENTTVTSQPEQVVSASSPVSFKFDDYVPGGAAAVAAGSEYFDMSAECALAPPPDPDPNPGYDPDPDPGYDPGWEGGCDVYVGECHDGCSQSCGYETCGGHSDGGCTDGYTEDGCGDYVDVDYASGSCEGCGICSDGCDIDVGCGSGGGDFVDNEWGLGDGEVRDWDRERWVPSEPLAPGLYYVPCDVDLPGDVVDSPISVVSSGQIRVSGSSVGFSPFSDGLLFYSSLSEDNAVEITSVSSTYSGYVYASEGRVELGGHRNRFSCAIVGGSIDMTDAEMAIDAADCGGPGDVAGSALLVPKLSTGVSVSPQSVIPGDSVTTTVSAEHDGVVFFIPGVVGFENLGDSAVTVNDVVVGLEYQPVGASDWVVVEGSVSLSSVPNPNDAVTYGADGFASTVVTAGGVASWGVFVRAELDTKTAALLVDTSRVAGIRTTFDLDLLNPAGEPIRRLFDKSSEFSSSLHSLSPDLGATKVFVSLPDGSSKIIDSSSETSFESIVLGASASVELTTKVPVVAGRGRGEPSAGYLTRLKSLDTTKLTASAYSLSTAAVGSVLGGFSSAQTTRIVPVVSQTLTAPEALVAGDSDVFVLEWSNVGSAPAASIQVSSSVDGANVDPKEDVPAGLVAGQISSGSVPIEIAADHSGGVVPVEAAASWTDANGNRYGAVVSESVVKVVAPPSLLVSLEDSLAVDADNSGVPSIGDTIGYKAKITNRGEVSAQDVVFSVDLDPKSTLNRPSVATSQGNVTVSANTVSVDVGSVTAGGSVEISFSVVADSGSKLSVQAKVTSSSADTVLSDDPGYGGSSDATVTNLVVSEAKVDMALAAKLVIDVGSDGPGSGDTFEYVLKAQNTGLVQATDVAVNIAIDENTKIVPGSVTLITDTTFAATRNTANEADAKTRSEIISDTPPDGETTSAAASGTEAETETTGGVVSSAAANADGVVGEIVSGNADGDTEIKFTLNKLGSFKAATLKFRVTVNDGIVEKTDVSVQASGVYSEQVEPVLSDDPSKPGTSDPTVVTVFGAKTGSGTGSDFDPPGDVGPGNTWVSPAGLSDVSVTSNQLITVPVPIRAKFAAPAGAKIVSWKVTAWPANGDRSAALVLAQGDGETPETLATFDPTVLSNGLWMLRIEASDDADGKGVHEIGVVVEGRLKLGRFSTTWVDSSAEVSGIGVRVVRTYDTIERHGFRDFGYGWTLDVSNFEVASNRPLHEPTFGARVCGSGLVFSPICFAADTDRIVNVTWPDGRVESFMLKGSGNTMLVRQVLVSYEPLGSATSQLLPVAGDDSGGIGAYGQLTKSMFSTENNDPQRFVLVAADGTRYLIDKSKGLLEAKDRNGNTVTYSDAGIISSQGPSLMFTRDDEGRITSLTEPGGATVSYSYDEAGDLVSVTDQNSTVSSFAYSAGHYLVNVDDVSAGSIESLTYDSDGRLASVTDRAGNTTTVSSDLASRSTVVSTPGGDTIVTTMDERGNMVSRTSGAGTVSVVYNSDDLPTSLTDTSGGSWSFGYDSKKNLTSLSDPGGGSESYSYDEFGRVTSFSDRLGGSWSYSYDGSGNLTAMSDGLGRSHSFSYNSSGVQTGRTDGAGGSWSRSVDDAGRTTSVTDPAGNTTAFGLDADGRIISRTWPDGGSESFGYDAEGNLVSHVDVLGGSWSYSYDTADRVISRSGPRGSAAWSYDPAGNVTSFVNEAGQTSSFTWSAQRLSSRSWPDGSVTSYSYDTAGRLATASGPDGTTSYGWDSGGRNTSITTPAGGWSMSYNANAVLTSVTNPAGETTSYGVNAAGQITSATDALGRTTSFSYDAGGQRTGASSPGGQSWSWGYDGAGRVTSIGTPDGSWALTRDAAGNAVSVSDAAGRTTTYGYDAMGRLVSAALPGGGTASWGWNVGGQLTSETTPAGITTAYSYDSAGYVISETSPAGSIGYGRDSAGRVTSITDRNGGTYTFSYDPMGRLISESDPMGAAVQYSYNSAGHLTALTSPNGGSRSYSRDGAGRATSVSDELGRVTNFGYDPMGRVTSITDPRGITVSRGFDAGGQLISESAGGETRGFSYNQDGYLIGFTDSTGATTIGRDVMGRVTNVAAPAGNVSYSYNAAGDRVSMTQPEGSTSYSYDGNGHLTGLTDWRGNTATFTNNADGKPTSASYSNGINVVYGYDAAGRLTNIGYSGPSGTIDTYNYTVDSNGNRTALSTKAGTETYSLDALNRITAVTYPDGTSERFGFDAAGNRTSHKRTDGTTVTYNVDAAGQISSDSAGTSYTYDAAGNLTGTSAGDAYAYDSWGNLTQATNSSGISTNAVFDAMGVRVEVDGVNQIWDRVGAFERLVSTSNGDSYVQVPGLAVNAGILRTGTDWHLRDAVGTIRHTTDSSGAVTANHNYSVYGQEIGNTAVGAGFGFAGEQSDPTGLIHLRARAYNPALGSFTSYDPVQPGGPSTQGWNHYSYAANNPTSWTDPTGQTVMVETGVTYAPQRSVDPTVTAVGIGTLATLLAVDAALRGVPQHLDSSTYLDTGITGRTTTITDDLVDALSGTTAPTPGKRKDPNPGRRTYPVPAWSERTDPPLSEEVDEEEELMPVWFGQKRIDPKFRGTHGAINEFDMNSGVAIPVFEHENHPGILIAHGNRRLAAYALQGVVRAPVCLHTKTGKDEDRLDEQPISPQTSLPSPVIAVTKHKGNLRKVDPWEVESKIWASRPTVPCKD